MMISHRALSGLAVVLPALLAGLMPTTSPAAEPPKLPPVLVRYTNFVACSQQYEAFTTGRVWATEYSANFAPDQPATWHTLDRDNAPPALERVTVEGASVLAVTARPSAAGSLAIGPKVSGGFAVEMIAQSDTDHPADLSIFTDGAGLGPGFGFGNYENKVNSLWVDKPNGSWGRWLVLTNECRIQPRQWHRVRLEVFAGTVSGSVDGQVLGAAKLSARYDATTLRQPVIYCFGTRMLVKQVTVYRRTTSAALDTEQAPERRRIFGAATDAEIDRQFTELVALLDDPAYAVREGAHRLLEQAGAPALAALEVAARSGTPEQRVRAREILKRYRAAHRPQTEGVTRPAPANFLR